METLTRFRPEGIRELREQANLSAAAFLRKTDIYVSRQAFSRWEQGQDFPTIKSLLKIANAFHVPITHFFSFDLSSNDNGKSRVAPV